MMLSPEIIVSSIGATLTTISFIPQTIKTIKTKNTKGISLLMYLLFTIGVGFWAAFGVLIENYPTVIANIITFILAGTVLVIKINNYFKNSDGE